VRWVSTFKTYVYQRGRKFGLVSINSKREKPQRRRLLQQQETFIS
jgi:hypothetical protein